MLAGDRLSIARSHAVRASTSLDSPDGAHRAGLCRVPSRAHDRHAIADRHRRRAASALSPLVSRFLKDRKSVV